MGVAKRRLTLGYGFMTMRRVDTSDLLRDRIEARITERGFLTYDAFAAACGLTPQGLARLRKGEVRRYQKRLTVPVCDVLGWSHDSIERMMRGEEPIEVSPSPPSSAEGLDARLAEMDRKIEETRSRLASLLLLVETGAVSQRRHRRPPPPPTAD